MNKHPNHPRDHSGTHDLSDRGARPNPLVESLRWAIETLGDPSMATANWVVHDIDPRFRSALALLTDPNVSLATLRQAKDVFKTMRMLGESSADRRLGARLYLASIAAALVHHNQRISTQSDQVFYKSLRSMLDDDTVPTPLRRLAGAALNRLGNVTQPNALNAEIAEDAGSG